MLIFILNIYFIFFSHLIKPSLRLYYARNEIIKTSFFLNFFTINIIYLFILSNIYTYILIKNKIIISLKKKKLFILILYKEFCVFSKKHSFYF